MNDAGDAGQANSESPGRPRLQPPKEWFLPTIFRDDINDALEELGISVKVTAARPMLAIHYKDDATGYDAVITVPAVTPALQCNYDRRSEWAIHMALTIANIANAAAEEGPQ